MTIIIDYVVMAVILCLAVIQDIKENKISNKLNVLGTVLGMLLALILPHRGVLDALLGVVACFLCGLLCWNLKMFRAGDAKLFCAMGSFLGWQLGLSCILYAIIAGSIIGIPKLILQRFMRKEKGNVKFPFAIAIAVGCVLCAVFGAIWSWIPAIT